MIYYGRPIGEKWSAGSQGTALGLRWHTDGPWTFYTGAGYDTDPTSADDRTADMPIDHIEEVEDRLVLQGVEDGRDDAADGTGWTISIETKNGRMVGTAAASQAAIVIFGACTEIRDKG